MINPIRRCFDIDRKEVFEVSEEEYRRAYKQYIRENVYVQEESLIYSHPLVLNGHTHWIYRIDEDYRRCKRCKHNNCCGGNCR